MGKLKEYYHEEISNGMMDSDQQYAVKNMTTLGDAADKWRQHEISTEELFEVMLREIEDFNNRHTPCRP